MRMAGPDVPADTDSDDEQDNDPKYIAGLWLSEIKRAQKKFKDWEDEGKKIVERYRDEKRAVRGAGGAAYTNNEAKARYNIFWSNTQTMLPALYAKAPKPAVGRRFLDKDVTGRIASEILKRALQYEIDSSRLHSALKLCTLDYLLPGRAQVWVSYAPEFEKLDDDSDEDAEDEPAAEKIKSESVAVDYVNWQDFLHDFARVWTEVTWVARRTYQTKDRATQRFGKDVADRLNYAYVAEDLKNDNRRTGSVEYQEMNEACIWEIWNKAKKEAIWVSEGFDEPLDQRPDPLKLLDFFPCPEPLMATTTNDSTIPVSYFRQYSFQAKEMDDLTKRLDRLIAACQVKGVYNQAIPSLGRIFREVDENEMIGVENWSQFAQAGGLKGALDWLPIQQNAEALKLLYEARASTKADIDEISGMSDIIRGQGDPGETATGTRTKGQFATLRLKAMQGDVARFARDIVRLMSEVICGQFQPETIEEMSSAKEMDDLQMQVPAGVPSPALGAPGGAPPAIGAPPGLPPQQPPPMGLPPQKLMFGAGASR